MLNKTSVDVTQTCQVYVADILSHRGVVMLSASADMTPWLVCLLVPACSVNNKRCIISQQDLNCVCAAHKAFPFPL